MNAWDAVVEIIKLIGNIIVLILVPYIAYRQRQLERNTNSVVTRLIIETKKVSEAIGKEKEQQAQKDREISG